MGEKLAGNFGTTRDFRGWKTTLSWGRSELEIGKFAEMGNLDPLKGNVLFLTANGHEFFELDITKEFYPWLAVTDFVVGDGGQQ